MKHGWVRLHRQIEDNPLWFSESFTKAQAWIDLFLNANHTEGKIFVRGNVVLIKRGQIGWSEITMIKRWGWSKGKVRRYLKYLETEQQIVQEKIHKITTLITICNYDMYQDDTTDSTTKGLQKDYRQYTIKNDKNEKNENNNTGGEVVLELREILRHYNEVFHKSYTSYKDLISNWTHWKGNGLTLDDAKQAITNAKSKDWWKDNLTPELLLRRTNPQREPVNHIETLKNYKPKNRVTYIQ